jgi:hypothetical protein
MAHGKQGSEPGSDAVQRIADKNTFVERETAT